MSEAPAASEPPQPVPRRHGSLRLLLGFVLLLGWYALLGLTRRIDADEGYFLSAAQLARWHLRPYADFYYPQGPLLPYLFGTLLTLLGGFDWLRARLAAALLAAVAALIFWGLLRLRVRSPWWRGGALLMYLGSDFGLEWAPTLKSLLPAGLFALAGVACVARPWLAGGHVPRARWAAFGACTGLAVLARLTLLPHAALLGAGLAWLVWRRRLAWREAAAWLLGFGVLLLPLAGFAALEPASAWICLVRSHTNVPPGMLATRWQTDGRVFLETNLNLWVLAAWLALAAAALAPRRAAPATLPASRARDFQAGLLLAYGAALFSALAPIWALHQYYALGTPWLLLAAAPLWEALYARTLRPWVHRRRALALGGALVLAALWVRSPYLALERFWPQWTWRPQAFQAREEFDWRISTVRAVQSVIDAHTQPREPVLTWWPGYVIGTHAWLWPGLNDHNALRISRFLSNEAAWAAKAITNGEVDQIIRERRAGLIVAGVWTGIEAYWGQQAYLDMIRAAGYEQIARIGAAYVFRRPAPPPPQLAPAPPTR